MSAAFNGANAVSILPEAMSLWSVCSEVFVIPRRDGIALSREAELWLMVVSESLRHADALAAGKVKPREEAEAREEMACWLAGSHVGSLEWIAGILEPFGIDIQLDAAREAFRRRIAGEAKGPGVMRRTAAYGAQPRDQTRDRKREAEKSRQRRLVRKAQRAKS